MEENAGLTASAWITPRKDNHHGQQTEACPEADEARQGQEVLMDQNKSSTARRITIAQEVFEAMMKASNYEGALSAVTDEAWAHEIAARFRQRLTKQLNANVPIESHSDITRCT